MLLKTSSPCESLPMPSQTRKNPALSLFVLDEVVKGIQKIWDICQIRIYNEERENNPILCFSSTDPNCMPNIGQMSKDGVNQMNSFKKNNSYIYYICPI